VTAACLLTRRDVFEAAGGFDEDLAVGFGDVDLCLRTGNLGYKILCDGEAVLIHHESASRSRGKNRDPHPEDSTEFVSRYQDDIWTGDPFYHPLLASTTWRYRPVRSPVRRLSPVYRIVTDPKIRRPN
jgi:GT2 family glycosyltransferase